jgi:anti-anti-sigma factor
MVYRAIEIETMAKFLDNWKEIMIKRNDFLIDEVLQKDVLYFAILEQELIMNISTHVGVAIKDIIKNEDFKYIVIDLKNVQRMDSSGFGMILTIASRLPRKERSNMFILNASTAVMRIANLIGLPVFTYMYDNINDVVEKIKELKNANL